MREFEKHFEITEDDLQLWHNRHNSLSKYNNDRLLSDKENNISKRAMSHERASKSISLQVTLCSYSYIDRVLFFEEHIRIVLLQNSTASKATKLQPFIKPRCTAGHLLRILCKCSLLEYLLLSC